MRSIDIGKSGVSVSAVILGCWQAGRKDWAGISDSLSERAVKAALDAGVPLRDVQLAARHADPRTTTVYDRRRENFDRHAAYVVVAYVAGG
jgi:hypothetical protein